MGESKRFKTDVDKEEFEFYFILKCYFNIYLSMLVLLDQSFFLLATFAVLFFCGDVFISYVGSITFVLISSNLILVWV